jgi:hypothetical protein
VLGIRRRFEFIFGSRPDAGFTHYSSNTVFAAPDVVIAKILMNPWGAIYAMACSM